MSRRHNRHVSRPFGSDIRSSFGDHYLDRAITEINKLQQKAVALMTNYELTREQTLPMIFRDEDIDAMHRVHALVNARNDVHSYPILNGDRECGGITVTLNIDFTDARLPAVEEPALHLQFDRMAPLLNFTAAVRAVHDRYEEVKGLLRWLNRNATPGAIRFYFPAAMKLVPDSLIWRELQEVPSRYTTPLHITEWLQVIRDAANTYTQTVLLPSGLEARPRGNMWLTFAPHKVSVGENVGYHTDQISYNI